MRLDLRTRLTGARAAALVLAVVAGASVNLVSAGWWTSTTGFTARAVAFESYALSDSPVRVDVFRKAIVWLPVWRPLRLTLTAQGADAASTLTIDAPLDAGAVQQIVPAASETQFDLVLSRLGERDGRVVLYCATAGVAASGAGPTLRGLRLSPELTWRSIARYALPGAGMGATFWLLLCVTVPNGLQPRRAAADTTRPRLRWREGAAAAGAVIGLLIVWAVIKPPLQAPDEPQHMVRAASVRLGPWVDGAQTVPMDARHTPPLLWGDSPILHPLIQHPERFLTRRDVAALEAQPPGRIPDGWRMQSAIASYPPLFYWYVFGALRASEALALTPWQTLHALRVAVVLLAGVLWGVVFVTLRAGGLTRARAAQALALLVGTPMYVYLGSSVSTDAPAVPLAVWLVLLCWRAARGTVAHGAIAVAALGLLLVRPTGIQMVFAISGSLIVCGWRRPDARAPALAAGRLLLLALLTAWAIFYAWSPPALSDGVGVAMSVLDYLRALPGRTPQLWVMFWGKLGWLEYAAPWPLYALMLAVAIATAVWMVRSCRGPAAEACQYFAMFALLLAASTFAGELANVHRTGYMLQGRYFLPALVVFVPLFAWGPRLLRASVLGSLGVLHVTLFWLTLQRYWRGDVAALLASLPF